MSDDTQERVRSKDNSSDKIIGGSNSYLTSTVFDTVEQQLASFRVRFSLVLLVLFVYPLLSNSYDLITTTGFLTWVFLALSLTLIWGFTGIFSFGQNAFFGIGGYVFGVSSINLIDITGATNVAFLSALLVPAIIAAVLGYFLFYGKVSGVYVAIITLAVTLILHLLFLRTAGTENKIGAARLGGYNGMNEIPNIAFGVGSATIELTPLLMYYFVVLVLAAVYVGFRQLLNSDYGYAMIAIREDEMRTEMFGYDIRKIKLQVFTLSAALGGVGGALYASWGNFISPPVFGLVAAALPVIWVTVGGRKTIIGPILAAFSLQYLQNTLAGGGSEFAPIILGLILLLVVLFLPQGIIPALRHVIQRYRGERT